VEEGQKCLFSCINNNANKLRAVMNYLKVYCNLIRNAQQRQVVEGYTEKHHIFPVSIFGKNNKIVVLTGREHYIAHALLEKIYLKRYGLRDQRTYKMIWAKGRKKSEETRRKMSESWKGRPSPLRGRVMPEEHRRKIGDSNAKTYKLLNPEGKLVIINNLTKFCADNNMDRSGFYKLLNGTYKQNNGWRLP
jgi:hypothetical protein